MDEEINEVCKSCGGKTFNGDLLCEECKEHFRKIDEEYEQEDSI